MTLGWIELVLTVNDFPSQWSWWQTLLVPKGRHQAFPSVGKNQCQRGNLTNLLGSREKPQSICVKTLETQIIKNWGATLGFQIFFFLSQPQFLQFGWWLLNVWCGQTGSALLSSVSPLWPKDLLAPGVDGVGCQGFSGRTSGLLPLTQLEMAGKPLWFFFLPLVGCMSETWCLCFLGKLRGFVLLCWWFRFWCSVSPLHCISVNRPNFCYFCQCRRAHEEHLCAQFPPGRHTIVTQLLFQC